MTGNENVLLPNIRNRLNRFNLDTTIRKSEVQDEEQRL